MKVKKLFAGVLSAAMLLGTMSFTALAEASTLDLLSIYCGLNDYDAGDPAASNETNIISVSANGFTPINAEADKFVVKLCNNDEVLAETTRKKATPFGTEISAKFWADGLPETEPGWTTEWNTRLTKSTAMNNFKFYYDDALLGTVNFDINTNYGDTATVAERIKTFKLPYAIVETAAELKTALSGAANNDTVIIDGTIANITKDVFEAAAGKTLTVKGENNDDELVFTNGNYTFAPLMNNANITFDGLSMTWGNYIYRGFTHTNEMTYNNCVINGQVFLYGNKETFNTCTFNQESADAYNVWTYGAGEAIFNNCTFNSNGKAMLVYNEGIGARTEQKVSVDGATFNAENPAEGKAAIEIGSNLNPKFNVSINNSTATGFAEGSVSGSTLYNVKDMHTATGTDGKITVDDELVVKVDGYEVDLTEAKANAINKLTVAKIGDTMYKSLETALAAAQAGDTITLVADAEITNVPNAKITLAETINLNGKTLTLNEGGIQLAGINFVGGEGETRGKIVATNNSGHQGVLYLCWGGTLTLKNIDIDATALDQAYVIEAQGWSENNIVLDNTTIDAKGDTTRDLSTVIAAWGGAFTMKDNSKIEVSNTTGHAINGSANVTITDSTVIAKNTEDGVYNHGGSLTVNGNSLVKVENPTGNPSWNPTAAGIVLKGTTAYEVADTATVDATIYREANAGNLTNKVKVALEEATENEGEKVYNIYLESDSDKTINRLTSAQLAFVFGTEDDLNFVVSGTDKVSVSNENGMHLFNFDGKTAADDTGVKIKLGQIKVTGYGVFYISVDETKENKAHATEIADNIVTDFVVGGTEDRGILELPIGIEDRIDVPTRKLTINITFPNAVKDNVKAYQDMHVTIKGGEYEETIDLGKAASAGDSASLMGLGGDLGTDSTAMADGAYKLVRNLEKDTPYTITVFGAGYRTAYYTVTMNADKTLNFWNNAKDTAMEVEEDKESSAKKVTFLAGDLVNDGKINIYDLSAVVSYFGTINNVNAASEYAKYDLNRDGKIDSKDVAYVLVSWGK